MINSWIMAQPNISSASPLWGHSMPNRTSYPTWRRSMPHGDAPWHVGALYTTWRCSMTRGGTPWHMGRSTSHVVPPCQIGMLHATWGCSMATLLGDDPLAENLLWTIATQSVLGFLAPLLHFARKLSTYLMPLITSTWYIPCRRGSYWYLVRRRYHQRYTTNICHQHNLHKWSKLWWASHRSQVSAACYEFGPLWAGSTTSSTSAHHGYRANRYYIQH